MGGGGGVRWVVGGARSSQAPAPSGPHFSGTLSPDTFRWRVHPDRSRATVPQHWSGGNGEGKTIREARHRAASTHSGDWKLGSAPPGMSVPYPVKIALALRSGNRCAMPSCRQLLSSEPSDDEYVMFGVAAHIAGGARGRHAGTPFGPVRPDDVGGRTELPGQSPVRLP